VRHRAGVNSETITLDAARAGDDAAFRGLVEPYRRELLAHMYRMTGSLHDAEDLLQDSLLKAWNGLDRFEGRSSLRTWLHRIATRTCLDALDQAPRRTLPLWRDSLSDPAEPFPPPVNEPVWLEPFPDALLSEETPEARATAREGIALAFLVMLQELPPRQRAAFLCCEVVGMKASDVAELLELSPAAVNSALQRAREKLASLRESAGPSPTLAVAGERELLARYVSAWENADVAELLSLLRDDATLSMPPFPGWFQGPKQIGRSLREMVLPPEAKGIFRFVATRANGLPAFAGYRREGASGPFQPAALHVLRLEGRQIAEILAFMDPTLFRHFGLPPSL